MLYDHQPLRHHFFVIDNGRGVQGNPFLAGLLPAPTAVGGLGIRIVRQCLRRLGAWASAAPVHDGRGTIVEVAIPCAA
ncbi:MAG: ATP-binding protein [Euryarchaeota archaeon]|nr:ATP-binding protein [Euryarchaeota archaeon]